MERQMTNDQDTNAGKVPQQLLKDLGDALKQHADRQAMVWDVVDELDELIVAIHEIGGQRENHGDSGR